MTTVHETPTSIIERVGAWDIEISMWDGLIAYHRSKRATYGASLTLFPIGYRVSAHWTDGVKSAAPEEFGIPKAVVKKANAMANRLTRKLQGDYA